MAAFVKRKAFGMYLKRWFTGQTALYDVWGW